MGITKNKKAARNRVKACTRNRSGKFARAADVPCEEVQCLQDEWLAEWEALEEELYAASFPEEGESRDIDEAEDRKTMSSEYLRRAESLLEDCAKTVEVRWRHVGYNLNVRGFGTSRASYFRTVDKKKKLLIAAKG